MLGYLMKRGVVPSDGGACKIASGDLPSLGFGDRRVLTLDAVRR